MDLLFDDCTSSLVLESYYYPKLKGCNYYCSLCTYSIYILNYFTLEIIVTFDFISGEVRRGGTVLSACTGNLRVQVRARRS